MIKRFLRTSLGVFPFLMLFLFVAITVAQEVLPTLPEALAELLAQNFNAAFLEVGALAGLTVVIVKVVRVLASQFLHKEIKGLAAYGVTIAVAIIAGVVGQLAGLVADPQYAAVPMGGIQFGLAAGLAAVGLHQGQRQTVEAVKTQADQLRR